MIPLRDDQPTSTFPFVTLLLIAVNAYVFIAWQIPTGLEESVALAGFLPVELTHHAAGGVTHLFSSMFMHGGWMHLIGNMWFLWIFGNNIEDNCGHVRYLVFYLLCGAAATLAFTALAPDSTVPLVGASGAISGVLGAYLLQHPHARVLTLVPLGFFTRIMEIPAWFFLLVWIGLQVFSQLAAASLRGEGSGVAYAAHIGGFVAGLGLILLFQNPRDRRQPGI
jgi:membrane associated rhomboid family serine protease